MADRTRASSTHCRTWRALCGLAAAGAAVDYLPAVAALGQWAPLDALPAGSCRWRGPRHVPRIALTFDDGPDPDATPAVLERLDELGMRASFFPLAWAARRHRDLLEEIARRGHVIGTHGFEHASHLLRGPMWAVRDVGEAAQVMHELARSPRWYRPAYGHVTAATLAAARAHGWQTVLWSSWGREWATRDPEAVAARIGRRLRPGAIVLLHDSDRNGPHGMWRVGLDALELVAARAAVLGLEAATLDEMLP